MKKIYKSSVQRLLFLFLTLAIQINMIFLVMLQFKYYFLYFYIISLAIGCILVFYILNGKSNPSYKIAWIVPILIFPIFGGTFYLIYGGNKLSKREKKKMKNQNIKMKSSLIQDPNVLDRLEKESEYAKNQALYTNPRIFYTFPHSLPCIALTPVFALKNKLFARRCPHGRASKNNRR